MAAAASVLERAGCAALVRPAAGFFRQNRRSQDILVVACYNQVRENILQFKFPGPGRDATARKAKNFVHKGLRGLVRAI